MFPPGMIPPPGAAAMPAMPIPWGAFAGMFGAPNMNVNVNGRPPNGPPFFGAGVQFQLERHFRIRAEVERYLVDSSEVDFWSLGVVFKF